MNILFITKFIPFPNDTGGKIGSYNLLSCICKDNNVDFVSFYENKAELEYLPLLQNICRNVNVLFKKISFESNQFRNILYFLFGLLGGTPYSLAKFNSRKLKKILKGLKNQYDVIIADGLNLFPYTQLFKTHYILQEHNIEFQIMKRYYLNEKNLIKRLLFYIDYKKLKKYEIESINKADDIIFVSEYNKNIITPFAASNKRFHVVPASVDTSFFKPLSPPYNFQSHLYSNGSLFYGPNFDGLLWFDQYILPLIQKKVTDVKVFHVGAFNSGHKDKLSANIELLGYVDDIRKFMNSNVIHIVPLRLGSGIRVKIINSLASGIPIVSTSMASEGINTTNGYNISIGDTPEEFAEETIKLIVNEDTRRKYIQNTSQIVEKYYSKEVFDRSILEIINTIPV